MTSGDQKLRIAVAVLDPVTGIGPTLDALIACGIALDQIGLIALRSTVGDLAEHVTSDRDARSPVAALIEHLAPLSQRAETHAILASPALLGRWRSGWRIPALWRNERGTADEPRLAADLERQVVRGCAVLTVQSPTPAEQWLCTRVLLELSSTPVLALEGSLPAVF